MSAKTRPPETGCGVDALVTVPFPSRPNWPRPQQYPAPAVVTPHAWLSPARIDLNISPPATAKGANRFAVDPLPSFPLLPFPQQYPAPAVVTPHAYCWPAEIEANA